MKPFRILGAALALIATVAQAQTVQTPLKYGTGAGGSKVVQSMQTGDATGVAYGGTSLNSLTTHCVVVGEGTTAPNLACPSVAGQVLKDNGASADPSFGVSSASANTAFVLIQTQTLSASAASVTFNSIPQGYTNLRLEISGRGDTSATSTSLVLRFNGDSGSNYDNEFSQLNNTTTTGFPQLAQTGAYFGNVPAATATAGFDASSFVDIANYAGTTFNKEGHYYSGMKRTNANGDLFTERGSFFWRSSSAITSLTVLPGAGNFIAGTVVSLYGVGGGNITVNPQPGLPVISEVVTSGSQTSVTFSNIPQTYRDLEVAISGQTLAAGANDQMNVQFNGDTGSNYIYETALAAGTAFVSSLQNLTASSILSGFLPGAGGVASDSGQVRFDVSNYAGTQLFKTLTSRGVIRNSTASGQSFVLNGSGWWSNTAAVTSLKISTSSGSGFVNGTVVTLYGIGGSPTATLPLTTPQGRLTLTSGSPVMTADATAQGTIYYDNYVGNLLPVGGIMYRVGELSDVLNSSAQLSGSLYDVFAYNSSGTIALCTGPAWSSTTARSAAISLTNGIWTNTASLTCTISGGSSTTTIAAAQATYLGTFYATANGQTGNAYRPAAASGGAAPCMCLYNAYNRVRRSTRSINSHADWQVTSSTWGTREGSTSDRVSIVDGLGQSEVRGWLQNYEYGATNNQGAVGMLEDATTGTPDMATMANITGAFEATEMSVEETFAPALGFHFLQAMQANLQNTGTVNMGGPSTGPTQAAQITVSLDN